MKGKGLDLLLIKPGSQKALYGELSDKGLTAIEPPLWAALMAGFARSRGFSVEIIDAEADSLSPKAIACAIEETNPLLTAVVVSGTNPSASTMNMIGVRAILEEVKELGLTTKTIVAGLHPSALPRRTLEEEKTDFVAEGEGFYTVTELIKALKEKPRGSDEFDTFDIRGLWYRQNGHMIANPRTELVKHLDEELKFPAWDLLPMDKYRAHNWHCFQEPEQKRQPYAAIYTSLGCPFKCHFCCINSIFGGPGIRYRSPEKVVEEIDCLVENYGVKNIKIIDEMFVLNPGHVLDISRLIVERGYKLNIWAYARINTVNERLLKGLKAAGVNWLAYGIESGSDRVLKSVSKGITVEKIKAVVKLTKDSGINVIGNYILGLPEDDVDSMRETMDLAMELDCEFINSYCATAYPGSPLYKDAVKEGYPLPDSWAGYSPYSYEHLPLRTKYLSGAEVLKFRDESYVKHILSPGYQKLVKEKFGEDVLKNITTSLGKKLKRKYLKEAPEKMGA